ncbi:MAG: TonB-dependent receptor [Candidatus Schekmanbacteria bacterium]|nr:TonB-dependent receptor [Candidatus Schekmanbacteria bacterium]
MNAPFFLPPHKFTQKILHYPEFKANYQDLGYGYVNYTWQDPRDSVTGDRLPDVSTHKGNIGVNIGLGKYVNFNSNLLVVGPRPRVNTDARTDLAGYEVLDIALIFKNFYKAMEIRAAIHNLLDESYFDPAAVGTVATDYPREGINCLVDVRYRF